MSSSQLESDRIDSWQHRYGTVTTLTVVKLTWDKPVHRCDSNIWHFKLVWHVELIVQFIDHGEVRGQVHYLGVG